MPCRRGVLSMPAFYSGARAARLEAYFGTRGDRLRRPNQWWSMRSAVASSSWSRI